MWETFHRFFWTFNGAFAAFFAVRAGFELINKTDDIKLWSIILVFCLFHTIVSLIGYNRYIGIGFLRNRRG